MENYLEQLDLIIDENRSKIANLLNDWGLKDAPVTSETLASLIVINGDNFLADLYATIRPEFANTVNFDGEDEEEDPLPNQMFANKQAADEKKSNAWSSFLEWGKTAATEILKTGSKVAADRLINGKNSNNAPLAPNNDKPEEDSTTKYLMYGIIAVVVLILAVAVVVSSKKTKF